MAPKTARKYLQLGKHPSEAVQELDWRMRMDPFAELWEEIREQLELNPGLEAKTLFARTWFLPVFSRIRPQKSTLRICARCCHLEYLT
jgi:hypothetical protein